MSDSDTLTAPPGLDAFPLAGRRTSAQATETLRTPGFSTRYPALINPEIIDPEVLGAMKPAWCQSHFPEADIEVFHLRDVYAIDDCLILDQQLRVIENVSDRVTDDRIQVAIQDILRHQAMGSTPRYAQGIAARRAGGGNFGHFLLEMLPMAVVARSLHTDWDPVYWAHLADPPLVDAMLRAFRLVGIPLDRIALLPYRTPAFFANLLVVRGLTAHGRYMSPTAVNIVRDMAASIPPGPKRRLFVRRIPGWHGARALTNQDELCARLAARGYEIIEPGAMSLEQQIAAFRGATQVVGTSGAAMTNILFCEPGTSVTNIIGARVPDTFFWFIANHMRLNYTELRCPQAPVDGPDGWKASLTICEADIRYLEELDPDSPMPSGQAPPSAVEGDLPQFGTVLAHVQSEGDIEAPINQRLSGRDPGHRIEGFAIHPEGDIAPRDIEYRGILGKTWRSPWVGGGAFCGTRGWSLPLFGLTVRLLGDTARKYECVYDARFADGSTRHAIPAGEDCMAETQAPLTSFTLRIRPRATAP
jgi:capsular polysaccharide biosynthesis protein